jgi:hypothetical protein
MPDPDHENQINYCALNKVNYYFYLMKKGKTHICPLTTTQCSMGPPG